MKGYVVEKYAGILMMRQCIKIFCRLKLFVNKVELYKFELINQDWIPIKVANIFFDYELEIKDTGIIHSTMCP